VIGDELMEHPDPIEPFGQPSTRQLLAVAVHQMDVVMILSPIITHEHCHRVSSRSVAIEPKNSRRRPNGSVLSARHPMSATGILTNWSGHDLTLGIKFQAAAVLTGQRLGTSLSLQPVATH
jgi:hypothetical protein